MAKYKKCKICLVSKSIDNFQVVDYGPKGRKYRRAVCFACHNQCRSDLRKKRQEQYPETTRAKRLFKAAKFRANKRNLPFSLDLDWVLKKIKAGVCEVTGIPFSKKIQKPPHRYTASIDKVVPKKGYTKENCRLVCLMVNSIKRDYLDEEIIDIGYSLKCWGETRTVGSDLEENLNSQIKKAKLDKGMVREFKAIPKRKFRIDFAWPEEKLAVEVQGGIWTRGRHVRPMGVVRDYEKFNLLTLLGWRVLLLTSLDVRSEKGLEMIQSALSESSSSSSQHSEE